MIRKIQMKTRSLLIVVSVILAGVAAMPVLAAEDPVQREKIDAAASAALEQLLAESEIAKSFADGATGILIFPRIAEMALARIIHGAP